MNPGPWGQSWVNSKEPCQGQGEQGRPQPRRDKPELQQQLLLDTIAEEGFKHWPESKEMQNLQNSPVFTRLTVELQTKITSNLWSHVI